MIQHHKLTGALEASYFMRSALAIGLVVLTFSSSAFGDEKPVTYIEHVKPVLRQHCLKCHGDDTQEADLNLQAFTTLLRGGSGGKIVEAGRSSKSRLIEVLTTADADARMPPNSPPLAKEKIELIRRWINTGLRETADSASLAKSRNLSFTPMTQNGLKPAGPPAMPGDLPTVAVSPTRRPLPILSMDASPAAPLLAIAAWKHVRLIQTKTKQEIGRLAFPEGEPHVIRFSQDGTIVMVAGGLPVQFGGVVLFDVKTGKRLAEIGDEVDAVLAADLSPNQELVALGGSGGVVKVYSTRDGALKYKLTKHTDWITSVAFSPDGLTLATADRAGGIHLWDAGAGGIRLNLSEHKSAVRGMDWRSDSKLLASVGEDGKVIWWDMADGFPAINKDNAHPPQRLPGVHGTIPNGVLALAFDRNGNLATAGRDHVVRLWDTNGQPLKAFPYEKGLPISLTVTSDGSVVSGRSTGVFQFHLLEK